MMIYLARHGESTGNVNKICYGHTDFPLTDKGAEDGRALGRKLEPIEFQVCYTSALCRAKQTALLALGGRETPLVETPLLNEQFMGDFENVPFGDLLVKYPKEAMAMISDWSGCPPLGGESFQQLYERVAQFGRELLEDGRDALIVAHHGSLAALTVFLLNLPLESGPAFHYEHGCYGVIRTSRRCNYLEGLNI